MCCRRPGIASANVNWSGRRSVVRTMYRVEARPTELWIMYQPGAIHLRFRFQPVSCTRTSVYGWEEYHESHSSSCRLWDAFQLKIWKTSGGSISKCRHNLLLQPEGDHRGPELFAFVLGTTVEQWSFVSSTKISLDAFASWWVWNMAGANVRLCLVDFRTRSLWQPSRQTCSVQVLIKNSAKACLPDLGPDLPTQCRLSIVQLRISRKIGRSWQWKSSTYVTDRGSDSLLSKNPGKWLHESELAMACNIYKYNNIYN